MHVVSLKTHYTTDAAQFVKFDMWSENNTSNTM